MATQVLTLSRTTPQQVSTGEGIRLQSLNGNTFYWAESTASPTNLNVRFRDTDVWIDAGKTIWVWAPHDNLQVAWG